MKESVDVKELERGETATRILDTAERMVAVRGFNGFSYADVAKELGITRAALHYHFASKTDLGEALISRYSHRFMDALRAVEARTTDVRRRLELFTDLYLDTLREGRMCLCGMMAAEHETLPARMRHAVVGFFNDNELWLDRVLSEGVRDQTIEIRVTPAETARSIVSSLEGGMLVARLYGDVAILQVVVDGLLADLHPSLPVVGPSVRD